MNKFILTLSFVLLGFTATARAESTPAAATSYPLTTCVVSGEDLHEMGGPVKYTHKEEGKPDREVQLCCKMCIGKFKKDPAKYLAKLDASSAAEPAPAAK